MVGGAWAQQPLLDDSLAILAIRGLGKCHHKNPQGQIKRTSLHHASLGPPGPMGAPSRSPPAAHIWAMEGSNTMCASALFTLIITLSTNVKCYRGTRAAHTTRTRLFLLVSFFQFSNPISHTEIRDSRYILAQNHNTQREATSPPACSTVIAYKIQS